jgi:hypothetical protein
MTDDELRAIVRAAIARHLDDAVPTERRPGGFASPQRHASHQLLVLRSGADDGTCLIEPAVTCNHCGYCVSYGH